MEFAHGHLVEKPVSVRNFSDSRIPWPMCMSHARLTASRDETGCNPLLQELHKPHQTLHAVCMHLH